MKPDDLLKVATEYPLPNIPAVELEDQDLMIEQLPQLISYLNPSRISWKENAKIIGPDETSIVTINENKKDDEIVYIRTPIKKIQMGWDFKINTHDLEMLIQDLINCKEGESYFNPSPWVRKDWIDDKKIIMENGEITPVDSIRTKEHELEKRTPPFSFDTKFYNPIYYYLNPFMLNSSEHINGKSNSYSLELSGTITFASAQEITLSKENTLVKVEGNSDIIISKSNHWKESKPYELVWNLKVPVMRLNCKPPFRLSLYKIYPSGVLPFLLKYKDHDLTLGLVNLNDEPVMAHIMLSARISSAYIINGQGIEVEKIESEFDRVRIPIRKNGIIYIRLTVKKLLESFLKRKIIG
ncbi:hypothetical protein [Stygiolobus caldivivus]|uniref:Uncharacterized protein n=1 Tax=Stygiolobus caldivivus TaxID=2824673 RepID=A0A8D5ZGR0_9CREN|nr:hypothetical protein [Stygiolobus caldivivus]BCU71173.1 hypothetical protein KN1_24700 [Stygiolobus caldivivus]